MQPVTLYLMITVSLSMASPNPPEILTKGDDFPAKNSIKPSIVLDSGEPIQSTATEFHLPLSGPLPIETGTPMPDGQTEMSPTEKALIAVRRADEAKKLIDQVKTWQGAVSRIKWVMDTVSPIVEVCAIYILPLLY